MSSRRFTRLTALLLIHALTIVPLLLLSPAWSKGETQFYGRVFEADGVTPLEGYAIALVEPETERVFRSEPTRDDGAFEIGDAPTGTYVVLAETAGGAYKASDAVKIVEGKNPPVSLSVNTLAPGQTATGSKGLPSWGKWTIFGAIAVAALFLINDSSDDVEENASEF